jgi:opacity protein-like surface antigen
LRSRLALVLALVVLPAAAASAGDERGLGGRLGGGVVFPVGAAGDRFKPGWQASAGASWAFGERLAVQLDYGYGRHRVVGQSLAPGFARGRQLLQRLDLDLRLTLDPGGPSLIYVLAGPSLVRRRVEITDVAGYEPGPAVCDPWLMVCEAAGAPLRRVVGSRDTTEAGLGAGVGIDVRLAGSVRFFVESRWLLVHGRDYRLPDGTTRRSTAAYLPLTFGLRF